MCLLTIMMRKNKEKLVLHLSIDINSIWPFCDCEVIYLVCVWKVDFDLDTYTFNIPWEKTLFGQLGFFSQYFNSRANWTVYLVVISPFLKTVNLIHKCLTIILSNWIKLKSHMQNFWFIHICFQSALSVSILKDVDVPT